MGGGISKMAKQELVAMIRDRYQQSSRFHLLIGDSL